MDNIQITGLNELKSDAYDKDQFMKALDHGMDKLNSVYKDVALQVVLKAYKDTKPKEKYSLHLRLTIEGHLVTAEETDWDLALAARRGFDKLHAQIEHKTHEKSKAWTGQRKKL